MMALSTMSSPPPPRRIHREQKEYLGRHARGLLQGGAPHALGLLLPPALRRLLGVIQLGPAGHAGGGLSHRTLLLWVALQQSRQVEFLQLGRRLQN